MARKNIKKQIRPYRRRLERYYAQERDGTPVRSLYSSGFAGVRSGQLVSEGTATQLSGLYRGINYIANSLMCMPWGAYAKTGSGPSPIVGFSLNRILNTKPNRYMAANIWRSTMAGYAVLGGNAWAQIIRDEAGFVTELGVPLPPHLVSLMVDQQTGDLFCRIRNVGDAIQNLVSNATVDIWYQDMFHARGYGNALLGDSVIAHGAKSMGTSLAIESNASDFYTNASRPSGFVTYPGGLSTPKKLELSDYIEEATGGANRNRLLVLDRNMSWATSGANPDDSQLLQNRAFQIEEIARWLSLPPSILMDYSKATRNNMEQASLDAVTNGLMPWAVRFEKEADIKLIPESLMDRVYTKINLRGLLRADTETRNAAYALGRQWSWLTANNVLEFEDMPTYPEGNTYLIPLNMERIGGDQPVSPVMIPDRTGMAGAIDFLVHALKHENRVHDDHASTLGEEVSQDQRTGDQDNLDVHSGLREMLKTIWTTILTRETNEIAKCGNREDFQDWLSGWMDKKHKDYIMNMLGAFNRGVSRMGFNPPDKLTIGIHVQEYLDDRVNGYRLKANLDNNLDVMAESLSKTWLNILVEVE